MQEVHADKVLMLAIGNNDYISYNKLFDRYYGRLCQYVYSLLMDRNDAEDVVQELFLNLWKNRGRIEIKRTNSVCNRSLKRCLVKRSEISGKGELDYKYMW